MKATKNFNWSLLFILAITMVVAGAVVLLYFQLSSDPLSDIIKKKQAVALAVIVSGPEKPLFIEIFFFNPVTHRGALLDIPEAWQSYIKSIDRMERLDYLYKKNNPGEMVKIIEKHLDLSIPFYMDLDINHLEKLTDLVEGLDFFIANPIEITDDKQLVLLPSGSLILDGSKLLTLIQTMEEYDTRIEAIGERQKIVQSFFKALGDNYSLLTRDDAFALVKKYIKTNLNAKAMRLLLKEFSEIDFENLITKPVYGREKKIENQLFFIPQHEGEIAQVAVKNILKSLENTEMLGDSELFVRVEILNGTTKNGLAGRTSNLFKSFGYDVVGLGNASSNHFEKTVVVGRVGNISKIQSVAKLINCKNIQTLDAFKKEHEEFAVGPNYGQIDVTIILGKDFDGRYCKD